MRRLFEAVWYIGEVLYSLIMLIVESADDRDEREQRQRLDQMRREWTDGTS